MVERRWGADKRTLACLGLSALGYGVMAHGVSGASQVQLWLMSYVLACGAYLGLCLRGRPLGWPLLLAAAIGFRLVLLSSPLWLSDDVYRYLLDGRVLAAGVHPFRYPPEHPLIQSIAPELAARVNHPSIPTIYPPTVQLVGYAAALLGLDVVGWRVLMSLCDIGVMLSVAALFGPGEPGRRAAVIYGLCPLALVESAANGHLEALLNLCFVAACLLALRRHGLAAGVVMGAAILCKFTPLLALPALWRKPRALRVGAIALGTAGAGLLAFQRPDIDAWAAMRNYLQHWSFNGPIYLVLRQGGFPEVWLRALPALWLLAVAWRWRKCDAPLPGIAWLYFGFLVASPTVHPWYALWLLPWLGPRPHLGLLGFILSMGLSYGVHGEFARSGEYRLPWHLATGIWMLVAVAFAVQWRMGRRVLMAT